MLLLTACNESAPAAVGLLESDRIEISVESNEPIIAINVIEGQQVETGDILLRQDDTRLRARESDARASIAALEAVLAEQLAGPREEEIEEARAVLEAARVELEFNRRDLERVQRLADRNVTSEESVDIARTRLETSRARVDQASARLRNLEAGTRQEQIEQTRQQLLAANARLDLILIEKQRLLSRAPADAVVDSLPFEIGERPPIGSVAAVLLSGAQPYARVYVPEAIRVNVRPGSSATLYVDGIENPFSGTVRRIAGEASFTPYFSLTERDRGRLSYLAEITLEAGSQRLPDGVPVEVIFPGP